jgi:hypothetical protein
MRKMPTMDIQNELVTSDILELTNEENTFFGCSGESHQLSYLESQIKKMSTLDIQEELTNSGILELTNEENVYSGYSGGAHQFRYLGAHKC